MRGSSYVELPEPIKKKRAIINVQNLDHACFAWAITSALRIPKGLPQRVSSYPHYNTVADFSELNFPVNLKDISNFEAKNEISINVYGLEDRFDGQITRHEIVGPLYFTKQKKMVHINLLLITTDDGNAHYCWIKNLSRLISSQGRSGYLSRSYICEGCLVFFSSNEKLQRHINEDCMQVKAIFPTTAPKINKYGNELPGNILMFDKFEKQLKTPFVIYADFEAALRPIQYAEPNPSHGYTVKCFEHQPYSYAYYIKCSYDDNLSKLVLYRGEDAASTFVKSIEDDVKFIYKSYLSTPVEMKELTKEEQQNFNDARICHICEKEFENSVHDVRVRDHDHRTGLYRGAAHILCNVNYKEPRFIPIIFHNLSSYDAHLFVKSLALEKEEVDVIAQNKEKYISFSKRIHVGDTIDLNGKLRKVFYKLRFLDSFRFMSSSLLKLASYLEDDQCKEIRRYFSDEKFKLVRQKGVFPYSYVTSTEVLNTTTLPSKDDFYDILSDSHISDDEYLRAKNTWNTFQCTSLGEYSDIYIQSDVLLLADVFENFRNICLSNYSLDPALYFTAPALSWDAMLRMTGVHLELLTDADMFHFFKKGIRGGVSVCCKRMDIANNQFLPNFNPDETQKHILYMDATNLYGYAMTSMLPLGDFEWLTNEELDAINVEALDDDGDMGYIFEVDLEYPKDLHDLHNDFPFCAEHVIPPHSKYSKLIPNLTDKRNYIIHYTTLKQCIQHGLILHKIRRGIKFTQSRWLKKYIDFNTLKRNEATNEFFKQFYKLMVNSIFGKTMENVENRLNIKLVTHWENIYRRLGAAAYIAKPNFKSCKIFSDSLTAIQLSQVSIEYAKPVYVGFTILEVAKKVMYDFYYGFLKPTYCDNISLLYTDTDSLIVSITNSNIYDDIKNNLSLFDTSNYKEDNQHGIPRGLPALGKMKDEYAGRIIECFYGTGAKAYCIKLLGKEVKTAKGVKRSVIDKTLSVCDYRDTVEGGATVLRNMYVFRSELHTMYTELRNKVALSCKDDKRYILADKFNTLAWGHYKIQENYGMEELLRTVLEHCEN